MFSASRLRPYVIPALTFQVVTFGGAYGTGREVAEFISVQGPVGGLLAWLYIVFFLGVLLALSFNIARRHRAYDYHRFIKRLFGRAASFIEAVLILLFPAILAVNISAASLILLNWFHFSLKIAVPLLLVGAVFLTTLKRCTIEKLIAASFVILLIVLIAYGLLVYAGSLEPIRGTLPAAGVPDLWWLNPSKYVFYNALIIPLLLHSTRDIQTEKEATLSGFLTAFTIMLPAFIMHLSFLSAYPDVLSVEFPVIYLLEKLNRPWLLYLYAAVLLGMIMLTIIGIIYGFNRYTSAWLEEQRGYGITRGEEYAILIGALALGAFFANLDYVKLVSNGYGGIAWIGFSILLVSLLIYGARKIRHGQRVFTVQKARRKGL